MRTFPLNGASDAPIDYVSPFVEVSQLSANTVYVDQCQTFWQVPKTDTLR